jgi:4-hydroxy-3-methylbut-2-enyl diphosphate reductase
MKINLAKSAGFCFGVKRALKIALDTAKSDKNVYMLGDIVHNETVVKLINKSGIRKILRLSRGKDKTLLIRAHGACKKTFSEAKRLGYKIVDATCPMVKEIHKIAKEAENQGYRIIIIGDKNHDEVHGISGQLKTGAIIIEKPNQAKKISFKGIDKACVVVQSTQNLQKVNQILGIIKTRIKNTKFFNTICQPTRIKQEEIRTMPLENEAMIVIGSKNSANTKRLYEISHTLNKNTYWIGSQNEINKNWLNNIKTIGITAGASTPEVVIRAVINQVRNYSRASHHNR